MSNLTDKDKTAIAAITIAAAFATLSGAGVILSATTAGLSIAALIGRREFPDIEEAIIEGIPEDVKLFLPAVSIALNQMKKDAQNSPLLSPKVLIEGEQDAERFNEALEPPENFLTVETELTRLFLNQPVWGVPDDADVQLMRELEESSTEIKVDCQSICVAAYASFALMKKKYLPSLSLDPSGASGREQWTSKSFKDDDILVTADAPMILGGEKFSFKKMFTVTRERQSLLFRPGGETRTDKRLFVYPSSSAEHQLMILNASRQDTGFSLPAKFIEEEITDLADYICLDRIMKPGDFIFAWDPLRTKLLDTGFLKEIPGTNFELPISLFVRDQSSLKGEVLDAFLRLYVAEMNAVEREPMQAWKLLLFDEPFRSSLIRGAGLRFRPDSE